MQSCFSIAIWAQAQQTPPLAAVLLRCATMVPTAAPPASPPSCGLTPTRVESPSWAPTLTWTPTLAAEDPESPPVEVVGGAGASAAGGEQRLHPLYRQPTGGRRAPSPVPGGPEKRNASKAWMLPLTLAQLPGQPSHVMCGLGVSHLAPRGGQGPRARLAAAREFFP